LRPGAQPKPSWLALVRDKVILAQYERMVMARPTVPVCIMNVTNQDQVLSEGTTIGHGEPAVCAAAIDDQKHEPRWKQGLCKQLREVIAGARPNMSPRETQALEELIAGYQDAFETKSGDLRCTEKVCHRTNTGDARPICQPPCGLPLAKQAEVNDMLEDMKKKGMTEESEILGHHLWCLSRRKMAAFTSAQTTKDSMT